jgi:hypothetical protein
MARHDLVLSAINISTCPLQVTFGMPAFTEPSLSLTEMRIVEASVSSLQDALCSGSIRRVEPVALYLPRGGGISTANCPGISLNSIPLLDGQVV